MRKIKFNAVALPLVFAASLSCLTASPTWAEPIALKLKEGETFNWTYKIRQAVSRDGKAPNVGGSATPFTLRVVEAGADGYVVEFQHGHTQLDTAHAAASLDPALKDLSSLVERLKIRVALSNRGELGKIQNIEELRAAGQEIIGAVASMRPSQDEQKEKKVLENIFGSETGIAAMFLKDVPLLLSCVDLDPADGASSTTEIELPNVFGGDPLEGTRTTTIKLSPSRTDAAEADVVQTVGRDSFIRMMNDLSMKATGKPVPENVFEGLFADGAFKDEMHFTCDLNTGLADVAKLKRTMTIPGRHQENEAEFTTVK